MNAILKSVRILKPEPEYLGVDKAAPETAIRRLRLMIANLCADPSLGSPLAIMLARGQIGRPQVEAVDKLLRQRRAYERAMGVKGLKSSTGEPVAKSEPPDPTSEAGMRITARDVRAVADYERAFGIVRNCGRADRELFVEFALNWPEGQEGQTPGHAIAAIRRVSQALHEYYYLTRRRAQREKRGG